MEAGNPAALMAKDRRGTYYIADVVKTRDTPGAVEKLIRQTAELDGPSVTIGMEQEPGSSGINTIDHYRRDVLPGFAFYGVRSTGAKELRAAPLSAQAEAGNIKLVGASWDGDFLAEAEGFPGGAHMDMIDSAASAHQLLATVRVEGGASYEPSTPSDDDDEPRRTESVNPFEEMVTWKDLPFEGMV